METLWIFPSIYPTLSLESWISNDSWNANMLVKVTKEMFVIFYIFFVGQIYSWKIRLSWLEPKVYIEGEKKGTGKKFLKIMSRLCSVFWALKYALVIHCIFAGWLLYFRGGQICSFVFFSHFYIAFPLKIRVACLGTMLNQNSLKFVHFWEN